MEVLRWDARCRLYGFLANEETKLECTLVLAHNSLLSQSKKDSLGVPDNRFQTAFKRVNHRQMVVIWAAKHLECIPLETFLSIIRDSLRKFAMSSLCYSLRIDVFLFPAYIKHLSLVDLHHEFFHQLVFAQPKAQYI